ncbi:hypothetical protein HDU86_002162 [Geranomyces michiganensis]|nr:hypothetical protein HDU86_002162 [Geranomyces michiganensis]
MLSNDPRSSPPALKQPLADNGSLNTPAPTPRTSQHYEEYLKRYELLLEFKHMRSPQNCPPGIYLKPSLDNLYEWFGTFFLHRGYYKEGVFQFSIQIPPTYPAHPPRVVFLTDMFHPLVARDGEFNIALGFPEWRPRKDHIANILHYMRNAFRESVLMTLEEHTCWNADALRIFRTEPALFAKLAAQCAQLSVSEGILFDDSEASAIRFSPMSDEHFEEVRAQMMKSQNPSI